MDRYIVEEDDEFVNDDKMPRSIVIERVRAINPFIKDLVIPVKVGVDTEGDTYEYEATPYVKHYCNYSARKNTILRLPASAIALYYYITSTIKWGNDWIWVNRKLHKEITGMAEDTYQKAVEILVINKIIADTKYPNVFNVNPQIFFKGNRISKYPTHTIDVELKIYKDYLKIKKQPI